MKNMILIFRNKMFTRLFLAKLTSELGTLIGMMCFTFYLLDRFGNQPAYTTIMEMMYSLPVLFVFLFTGVIADRFDRQLISYSSDWIRAGLTLLILPSIWIGWMPLIYALIFLRVAVSKFFVSAQGALVQGILSEEEYATAGGLNSMLSSVFILFGSGLGVATYWTVGIEGALLIDAAGLTLSALLIRSCDIAEEVRLPNGRTRWSDVSFETIWKDFKEGIHYILRNRLLLAISAGFFMFGIINGGLSVLPIFVMKYKLAPESYEEIAVLQGLIFGIGVLGGSVLAASLAGKIRLHYMIIFGFLVCGILVSINGFVPTVAWYLGIHFLFSLALPLVNVAFAGWIPLIVEPKIRGRFIGVTEPMVMLSQTITLGLIAIAFPKAVTLEMLFLLVGGSLFLVGVYYLITLPRLASENVSTDKSNVPISSST